MKTTTLFISCLLSIAVYAQDPDPRLFDTQWYLTSLVVAANNIEIPKTNELDNIEVTFQTSGVRTLACDVIRSDIDVSNFNESSFIADAWFILPLGCTQQSTSDFQDFYFDQFFKFDEFNVPFTYTLEEVGAEGLQLTITNSEGDTAVYGNAALAIQETPTATVALFPNPATDTVRVQLTENTFIESVHIYSLQGALVAQEKTKGTNIYTLNLDQLAAGIYFFQVIDTRGRIHIQRLVKN
tara:strand:- start:75128 stop:75847 length:720 start_codon:yes stop_codon:yes gene_type:complete